MSEKKYSLEDIEELWRTFAEEKDLDSPYYDFIGFIERNDIFRKTKLVEKYAPMFHDRLIAEPKLTKE